MSVLVILGFSSVASASTSTSKCELSEIDSTASPASDYSLSNTAERADLVLLREDLKRLDSLVLSKPLDSNVPRKSMSGIDEDINADGGNAAEMLAEKRLLERQSDSQESSTVKTRLPGVESSNVRAFRKQMYRTDI